MSIKDYLNKYSDYRADKLNAKCANNSKDLLTYVSAIRKIKNDKIILDVVKNAYFTEPQICAVGYIKDESILTEIAWSHRVTEVRRAAVLSLNDKNVLIQFAKRDNQAAVREAAVCKLTDQNILYEIINNDKNPSVQYAAVKNLIDQTILKEIAKSDKSSSIRKVAVQKISDISFLSKITEEEPDDSIRVTAVDKLTDQSTLIKIASNDNSELVRNTAVVKISDQSALIIIASNDNSELVRNAAQEMISDYVERAKIVKKWDDLLTSEALSQKDVYSFLSTYNKIKNKLPHIEIEKRVISILHKNNFGFNQIDNCIPNLKLFMDNDLEIKYKDYMGVLYINFTELVSLNILRKIGEEVSTSWCISQLQPFIQYSNKNNETIKRALVIRWDKSPFTRLKAVQITLCYILARCAEKLSDKTIHDVAFMNNYIVESHTEIIGRDQYDEYRTDTNDRWLLSYFGLFAKIIAESEVRRRKGTNSNYSVWEFPRDSSDHSSFYPGKIKDRLAREEAETIKKELVQTGKNVIILLTPS